VPTIKCDSVGVALISPALKLRVEVVGWAIGAGRCRSRSWRRERDRSRCRYAVALAGNTRRPQWNVRGVFGYELACEATLDIGVEHAGPEYGWYVEGRGLLGTGAEGAEGGTGLSVGGRGP